MGITSLFLLPLLLLINAVVGQRPGESRSLLDVQCAATTSSFESFLFLDLKVNSDLNGPQLIELEYAVKDTYNAYTKSNYCDLKFRTIFEVEATFWEQIDEQGTVRLLLRIDGRCKGCSVADDIFSLKTRRDLAPLKRILKGKGMTKAGSGMKICSCRKGVGFGTPSNKEYGPILQRRISSKKKKGFFPSIDQFLSIIEIDPVPCGEETVFDSAVSMTFGSSKSAADINPNDVTSLPGGFKEVYNELQQGRCDSQFRTIDSGDALLLNIRRLDESMPELERGLATQAKYIVSVNMSLRGRCRNCPSKSVLYNDAVKRRELQENQQTGLCFCAAGADSAGRSGPPSSGEFTKAYTSWIEVERTAGRLTDLVSAESTTQIDPLDQSASPSYQATMQSFNPTTKPPKPPITPPSVNPTTAPTVSPPRPVVNPTAAPTTAPPSRSPSLNQSVSPSLARSSDPSMPPSMAPSSNNLPSAMPSFSTLCSGIGLDSQLLFQQFENDNTTGWTNIAIDQSGSDFSKFLGRFKSGDSFPEFVYKGFNSTNIEMLFFGLTFYEIDNWKGDGPGEVDNLSMKIEGDMVDTIKFGSFNGNSSDLSRSGNSTDGIITWAIKSEPIKSSPQGFLAFTDQRHRITVGIPHSFFEVNAEIKVTIAWRLVGLVEDKFVGLDDLIVTSCVSNSPG